MSIWTLTSSKKCHNCKKCVFYCDAKDEHILWGQVMFVVSCFKQPKYILVPFYIVSVYIPDKLFKKLVNAN